MDFQYTPEQDAFRTEVRNWLAANLDSALCVDDPKDERVAPDRETFEKRRIWQRTMYDCGWVGIAWPKEYGGRGAGLLEQVIFDEEYTNAHAPVLPGYSGIALCGPTLMHWGTDEQKERFLKRILNGDDVWCQGYSEPGAGSDLAGLQTKAVAEGDDFIINGQKVWTSGAQYADWIFMLVRTDPDAPKASRHQLYTGQYADSWGDGSALGADERSFTFQRSLFRRRARCPRPTWLARSTRAGR